MRKKFLTNLILLLFLNFLIKPFWIFGIDVNVQNIVSTESYGFYFSILNFSFLFQILLDFGITNYNNRNIAQNNHLLNKYFSSIIILRFLFSFIYLLVIMGAGWLIGYDSKQLFLLFIIGINQFLLSLILYLRSNISALMMFKTDSIISVLDRLLMIIICSLLIWGNLGLGKMTIHWFVYSQTFSYLFTAIVAMFIVVRKAKFLKLNWNFQFFVLIIKQSWPYGLLVVLMGFYGRVDSVFIERLLGSEGQLQSGIYASAYRLLDAANNMSGYLFAVLLLPIFARLIKIGQDVSKMVKLSFTMLYLASVTMAISSLFFSTEIMSFLYEKHDNEIAFNYAARIAETSHIFSVLMFSYIAISSTYIFGTLLTANGSLKQLNLMAAFGIVISFGLNLLLIPTYKALGSAYASLAAQGLTAIIQLWLAYRIVGFKIERIYIVRLIIFAIGVLVINFASTTISLQWFYQFFIMGISSLALAFFLKLLDLKAFFAILRSE